MLDNDFRLVIILSVRNANMGHLYLEKEGQRMAEEILVVQSKVREYIKAHNDFRTSAEAIEATSNAVKKLLDAAIARCEANGRKTVSKSDV